MASSTVVDDTPQSVCVFGRRLFFHMIYESDDRMAMTFKAVSDVVKFTVNGGRIYIQETDAMRITGSFVSNP